MSHRSLKAALICATLPLGLLAAGCSSTGAGSGPVTVSDNVGAAGLHAIVAGNWEAAKIDFNRDYRDHPAHPVAVFNMGATYDHDGNTDQADSMFNEAVVSGRGLRPERTLEPIEAGITVAEQSCFRLHQDHKLNADCDDQLALAAPIAPSQAEPAIEAEATTPEAPIEAEATTGPAKQDRN